MEYAENKPGAYGYSRYCELYGQWKKKLNPTMRQRHRAGEKTFVDFSGKKPHIVDPKTGELVEMELFVGTLGASSYTYVEATLNQSLESWAKAHKGMSDYFGGSTASTPGAPDANVAYAPGSWSSAPFLSCGDATRFPLNRTSTTEAVTRASTFS